MLTIVKLFTKVENSELEMVAMLSIDPTRNEYFMWRKGWDDTSRVSKAVALGQAARWPRLSRFDCVTFECEPYFAPQVA